LWPVRKRQEQRGPLREWLEESQARASLLQAALHLPVPNQESWQGASALLASAQFPQAASPSALELPAQRSLAQRQL
jgi:hypothetical protein